MGRVRIVSLSWKWRGNVQGNDMGISVLVSSCVALGLDLERLTDLERELVREAPPAEVDASQLRKAILEGGDPLGDMFSALRPSAERRLEGQTFTPLWHGLRKRRSRLVSLILEQGRDGSSFVHSENFRMLKELQSIRILLLC